MLITGNPFSDLLTYLSLALPLLSICLILFRREYADNSSTLVMILCLFYFVQRLLVLYHGLFELSFPLVHNLSNLLEFLLLIFILKASFPELKSHYILNSFVIAYFSSIITYYGVRGFGNDEFELRVIQYGLITLLMGTALLFQGKKEQLTMMNRPLFWIILGTLFYFAFCTFWEVGKKYLFMSGGDQRSEIEVFPLLIVTIRFGFYTLAMWMLRSQEASDRPVMATPSTRYPEEASEEMAYFSLMTASEIPGEKIL